MDGKLFHVRCRDPRAMAADGAVTAVGAEIRRTASRPRTGASRRDALMTGFPAMHRFLHNDAMLWALGASLVVHGIVLLQLPQARAKPVYQMLQVTLLAGNEEAGGATTHVLRTPPAKRAPVFHHENSVRNTQETAPRPMPARTAALVPVEASSPPGTNSGEAAEAAERAAAEADALSRYRGALTVLAQKYKRYPELALLRHWEGAVTVRVAVLRDGKLDKISVVQPSGHDLLDREAVEMVNEAASSVDVPIMLRSRAFATDLSIVFTIEDN